MKKTLSIALIFIIVFSAFQMFLIQSSGLETEYQHRRTIIVDNSGNPETLTNYQVLLNVTYDSDMQADFDDLRFTWYDEASGEDVDIDYWLDKYVDSEYALVWVEVPEIRGSGEEVLYMYYGDPDAVSESNGEETFVFFDGFSTDTTANYHLWSPYYLTGNPNELSWNPSGWLFVNASIRECYGRNSNVHVHHKTAVMDPSEDQYWLETRCKAFGDGWLDYLGVSNTYKRDSTPQNLYFRLARVDQGIRDQYPMNFSGLSVWWGGVECSATSPLPTPVIDQWFRIGLGTASNGTVIGSFHDDNYGELATLVCHTIHQDVKWWVDLIISRILTDTWATMHAYFDYVRVRKFTDPEPSYIILLPATVDVDPDTLNLKSNGQWITAYIELPEGYCVSEIDVSSILLNGSISVDAEAPTEVGDYDIDSVPDLMVKFERAAVTALLGTYDYGEETGRSVDVALVIAGEVSRTPFEGIDTIRVLLKG